jgi:uncharacterized protein (DUF2147 family)
MFYRLSAYAIAAALFPIASASAQDTFPSGVWTDADRSVVVRIGLCAPASAVFCGTILEDNRAGQAANPPGHQLVRDLKLGRSGWGGKLVDGGMTLNFTMRPQPRDTAQVRFCFGVICDTETWQRVSSVPASNAPLRR